MRYRGSQAPSRCAPGLTSADGVVLEWTLDTEELIGLASQRVTRTLTPAECDRYGIEDCP